MARIGHVHAARRRFLRRDRRPAVELLAPWVIACEAGLADRVKLPRCMIRARLEGVFEVDPVSYAAALGERRLVADRGMLDDEHPDSLWVPVRLAIPRRDIDMIVQWRAAI